MTVAYFNSAGELNDYVNDNSVPQADIQQIVFANGLWYIFHW